MSGIDNTSSPERMELNALGLFTVGSSSWIVGQEAVGQRQLVTSESLPTDTGETDADFLAFGFTFGEPPTEDPMFRPVTLPSGWTKKSSDHSMWSHVVDQHGRRRVAVFYKAAFYDRSAFMRLESVSSYARHLESSGDLPVYDDTWCTREAFGDEVAILRASLTEKLAKATEMSAKDDPDGYWATRVPELTADLVSFETWASRIETSEEKA